MAYRPTATISHGPDNRRLFSGRPTKLWYHILQRHGYWRSQEFVLGVRYSPIKTNLRITLSNLSR